MKTASHETFGAPSEVMQPREVSRPEPEPGQILARMILSPIHNHDLWTIRGEYGYKPELPAVGGSEALGVVEAVGEGVDESMVGKRIVSAGVRGAWAEYFVASAAAAIPLPDAIPDELGAQLVAMPFSAISLLDSLNVEPGDWIIQNAANGAVGKVMAVLAAKRGVNLVNLVRREGAVAELADLGIGNIVVTDGDWKAEVKELTGNDGARAAVDSVGGQMAADLTDLLGFEGELISFGTATGEPLRLNSGTLIFKQITVRGFWGSKVSRAMSAEKKGELFGELLSLAAAGELELPVGGKFSLEDAAEAVAAAQVPGRNGKILLHP
jgi:NADPH:quinone reductase-like Zn-dependent oxidoreductase